MGGADRRRPPVGLQRYPPDDVPGARLRRPPEVRYGITSMCIGLGMGGTVIWENTNHTQEA